jgi:EmrB/QacA subfamily drug resistance transporter
MIKVYRDASDVGEGRAHGKWAGATRRRTGVRTLPGQQRALKSPLRGRSTRQPVAGVRRAAVVGVCCLTVFIIAIDTTVVNLALPLIGRGLHAPVSGLQWTIAAYSVTTASLMLTSGAIGDRFGRRAVMQAGLAVFIVASAGCSLAPGVGLLIACRALQGAGGSALTPMAMGVITATVPDPAARARAMGIWSGTFGAGMAVGPVLGGILADAWGWRSVFWINIPVGVIAMVLAGLLIPASHPARQRRADPVGQALVITFLACLVYGIIEGQPAGWGSPLIVATFAVSAAAMALLARWEQRHPEPLISLRAFRSVPFSGALAITLCAFTALGGFLFLTSLYLQDVHGLTAWQAGLRLVPVAAATAAAGPFAGRVMARHGVRAPLTAAGAALTGSCLMLALAPGEASAAFLTGAYAAFGVGYGAVNTVIADAAVAGMPRAQAGVAGGMTSAVRQAGHALGPSLAGTILVSSLHGPLRDGFAAASRPAWLTLTACAAAVLVLGVVTTSRGALRTAGLAGARAHDQPVSSASSRARTSSASGAPSSV